MGHCWGDVGHSISLCRLGKSADLREVQAASEFAIFVMRAVALAWRQWALIRGRLLGNGALPRSAIFRRTPTGGLLGCLPLAKNLRISPVCSAG